MISRYFSKNINGPQEKNVINNEIKEERRQKMDSIPTNDVLPEVPLPKYMKWSQVHKNIHELEPMKEDGEEGTRSCLTPLESQVMDLKAKYPKLTLFVECGYRYRFFGEDAIAAAKVLDIALIRDSKFLTASLPTFSGPMKYVRKFVEHGYKVGIVSQEGESSQYGRNLSRSVTEIYTQATLLNTDIPLVDSIKDGNTDVTSGIITLCEMPRKKLSSRISIVYFDPKNGSLIYDQFIDSRFRDQLSSRIIAFGAVEILFDELEVTKETKDVLSAISSATLEPYNFKSDHSYSSEMSEELKNVIKNENLDILKCIGAIYNYLKEFNIQDCLCKTGNVINFRDMPRFMKLSSYTILNLELFKTSANAKKGSVFDFLNQTCTKFGSRILRNWLAYPLLSKETITSRQEAIEELISDETLFKSIRGLLYRMPDLELALMSTLNKRISPKDFYLFIKEMKKSYEICKTITPKSQLLQNIVQNITKRLHGVEKHIKNLNPYSFSSNKVTLWSQIFMDYSEYPEVYKVRESLEEVEWSLETYKLRLMNILGEYTFEYSSLGGMDYLIEVKNTKKVPDSWIKVSNTKSYVRYRDPVIQDKVLNLSSMKETLNNVCMKAWKDFLSKFALCNIEYQYGINSLAELDALYALAIVSKSEGYVKPIFTETTFDIINGRNPILEHIQGHGSTFIPNDLYLEKQRTLIITGPNSGGKSSFIRQTALISLLAQMGCHVPATKARLPIVDAIFLRTGAKDDIWNRKSTFHVEMEETCDIIRGASENSLVLLDELGRGTSSYDGLALAESVLKYLIFKSNCFTLFVTHYGTLSSEFERLYGNKVKNAQAGYAFLSDKESSPILLYKICPGGTTNKSYGINVARLAGLPSDVLERASTLSRIYERDFNLKSKMLQLIHEYHTY